MRRADHYYLVEIDLEFTREEINLLAACARDHYDAKCIEANERGFINGMRNCLPTGTQPKDTAVWRFSWSEVDLAAKITECVGYQRDPTVQSLSAFFYETIRHLNDLAKQVNGSGC